MENEHEAVGNFVEEIRKFTKNFTLPEDACASYTLWYKMLEEFEEDLHLHIHLENNILFPKAIELEKV
jgi:regulator of cell morphogenesis and NO signaling